MGTTPVSSTPGANWRLASGSQNLRVDDSRAHSGSKSLKITVTPGASSDQMLTTLRDDIFPAARIHARMMVYFDDVPMGASPFHWNVMRALGAFPPDSGIMRTGPRLGVGGWAKSPDSGLQSIMATTGGAEGKLDCWNHTSHKLPVGKWTCLEWHMDSATHTHKVTIDAMVGAKLSFTKIPSGDKGRGCLGGTQATPWFVPQLTNLSVGFQYWHTLAEQRTVWIDDVVISKEPIGCPTP